MKILVCFILLTASINTLADSHGFWGGVNLGYLQADLDSDVTPDQTDKNMAALGASLSYQTQWNIFAQISANHAENYSLFGTFDRYTLRDNSILVGYEAKWKSFSLSPIVGVSFWDLEFKEGQILNPGSEEQTETSGNDFVWGLSAAVWTNPRFKTRLSHRVTETSFGDYQLSYIELTLRF